MGRVKTRLIPDLGVGGARRVHRQILVKTAKMLMANDAGKVELCVTDESPLFRALAYRGLSVTRQCDGDLGQRMFDAIATGLLRADRVVLVGSDCPQLSTDYIHAAIAALDNHDLVLGPALDGGYVLIAARRIHANLFRGVKWGSDQVLLQTLERARELGYSLKTLNTLRDVDTLADWQWWNKLRPPRGAAAKNRLQALTDPSNGASSVGAS